MTNGLLSEWSSAPPLPPLPPRILIVILLLFILFIDWFFSSFLTFYLTNHYYLMYLSIFLPMFPLLYWYQPLFWNITKLYAKKIQKIKSSCTLCHKIWNKKNAQNKNKEIKRVCPEWQKHFSTTITLKWFAQVDNSMLIGLLKYPFQSDW